MVVYFYIFIETKAIIYFNPIKLCNLVAFVLLHYMLGSSPDFLGTMCDLCQNANIFSWKLFENIHYNTKALTIFFFYNNKLPFSKSHITQTCIILLIWTKS